MDKTELAARKSIIHSALSMNAMGINQGTSGNVSVRYGDRMIITPSGIPYEELSPAFRTRSRIARERLGVSANSIHACAHAEELGGTMLKDLAALFDEKEEAPRRTRMAPPPMAVR